MYLLIPIRNKLKWERIDWRKYPTILVLKKPNKSQVCTICYFIPTVYGGTWCFNAVRTVKMAEATRMKRRRTATPFNNTFITPSSQSKSVGGIYILNIVLLLFADFSDTNDEESTRYGQGKVHLLVLLFLTDLLCINRSMMFGKSRRWKGIHITTHPPTLPLYSIFNVTILKKLYIIYLFIWITSTSWNIFVCLTSHTALLPNKLVYFLVALSIIWNPFCHL